MLTKRKTIAAAFMAAVAAVLIVVGVVAQQAGSKKSYTRPTRPSVEETLKELPNLEGEKRVEGGDRKIDPNLKAENLQRHGIYRIVPANFAGELPYEEIGGPPTSPGVRSDDPAVLRNSPLYVEVRDLPPGFERVLVDTHDGTSTTVVRQVFRAGSAEIEVSRVRRSITPIDVFAPPTDGGSALELGLSRVGQSEAIVLSPSVGAPAGFQYAAIRFYGGGVETFITGRGVPVEALVGIASSIASPLGGSQ